MSVIIGGLTALISFGIALVYRANRIVNFAQGDLGPVPTVVAVVLIASVGLPYFAALGVGLAVAVGLGATEPRGRARRLNRAWRVRRRPRPREPAWPGRPRAARCAPR